MGRMFHLFLTRFNCLFKPGPHFDDRQNVLVFRGERLGRRGPTMLRNGFHVDVSAVAGDDDGGGKRLLRRG